MNHILIGQIAGVMALVQAIPYIVSTLNGHTKPERMTYFIFLVVDTLTIASYIAIGARSTIWVGLAYVLTGLTIFLLSLKYGMGGFSKLDIMCLLFALAGVVVWAMTDSALSALCLSIFATKVGYLPTIKKAYFYPETENTLSWTMTAFTSMLNIFALTTLEPIIALPIILGAVFPTLMAYLLLFPVAHHKISKRRKASRIHTFLSHPIMLR